MIEDFATGGLIGYLVGGLIGSFKRHWKLWLAAFVAFLIYRHFVLGAN